jgi:phage terminase small subunit
MTTDKLTVKQRAFADYYIQFGNATEAARKAGYSEKYTNTNANKLLQNTTIRIYIDERLKQIEDERIADAAEVLKYLTSVMRNEETEEVVVVEGYGEGCSSAKKVEKDISVKDRNKAAELLGKRYRLFTDKVEVEGAIPVVIVDDLDEDDDE